MTRTATLTATEIRQQFIDFFEQRASHTFVPSSPVVPHDDPTLLFTNAGMNQFKPLFLGEVQPGSPLAGMKRAVNSQKCIRAGGKHNDLDDVGKDLYHHTFFEMLGNWSFGDYFKAEAIQWAWELLTNVWGLDPGRLYATYFEGSKSIDLGPDREAYELWQQYLPADRILPGNMKDNFWEMGDTGPCGPCSEIHYDGRSDEDRARVPGYQLVNRESPDVIEIWNLVFIQYNRTAEGLFPLPARHVDTGMGLERVTRVIQGKNSTYDTDIFADLFTRIQQTCNAPVYTGSLTRPEDIAYRVIADHARTLTFAITDGAEPSNDGRGYVLRRILRRAVRYGRQTLGVEKPFLCELVPTIVDLMGGAFPELRERPQHVIDVIRDEEEAFGKTLHYGIALFDKAANSATERKPGAGHLVISADDAFRLHDTYGFPVDLTQLMAEERGMGVDVKGFDKLMEQARLRSRQTGKASEQSAVRLTGTAIAMLKNMQVRPTQDPDKFVERKIRARITAIWNGTDLDENIIAANTRATDRFAIILDKTNFYAEMGGQVTDQGRIVVQHSRNNSSNGEFIVESVVNHGGYIAHAGRAAKGELRVGDEVELRVDRPRRKAIAANHTSTHLLNLALRKVLGDHVDQKGSLVAPDRLRFDFSHNKPLTTEQVREVEKRVGKAIGQDLEVFSDLVPLEQGRRIKGLRAVFGETYPDPVRVVSIGMPVSSLIAVPDNDKWLEYSIEFCGGTHLDRTGVAQHFAIVGEESVAKGVRRITALTDSAAADAAREADRLTSRIEGAAQIGDQYLADEVKALHELVEQAVISVVRRADLLLQLKPLDERVRSFTKAEAEAERDQAVEAARELAEVEQGLAIVGQVPAGDDRTVLLAAMDTVRARHEEAAIMLLSGDPGEGKVAIVAKVPDALIQRGLKAGDWVRHASSICGGKGGGRPDSAQGGGTDPSKIAEAIQAARAFAEEKINP